MAFKTTTLFPNYLLQGKLEIPLDNNSEIISDIKSISDSGFAQETSFGWVTDKKRGLPVENLHKLSMLIANVFARDMSKYYHLDNQQIEIVEPYLISVKPGHTFQINLERSRWYNVCVWLQTTNKGCYLLLEDFGPKLFIGPPVVSHTELVKPQVNKCVCWPSHIPWGFTSNESMTDSIMLVATINAPNKRAINR